MLIEWNEEKNIEVSSKEERFFISFKDCKEKILAWEILAILPNKNKPHQKIFVLKIKNYPIAVPFVETEKWIFLKTLYPERRFKKYLKEDL